LQPLGGIGFAKHHNCCWKNTTGRRDGGLQP
jgi:hypothetical protein